MTMSTQPKMFTLSLALAVACAGLAGVGSSAVQAAVSYKYATDITALNLLPGESGSVNLYLVETTTDSSTSRLANESGLSSAYVGVTYVPPGVPLASPSTISSISADTAIFNDIAGPDEIVAGDHLSAFVREYVDIAQPTGPSGTLIGPGIRHVFLGTVVVLGGNSGGTTTFQVGDNPITDDTVTIDGYANPLDAGGAIAPATFTVTIPVPEPTIGTACILLAPGLMAARRRRHG